MANLNLPAYERNLTPDQVELIDKRRRRGQLLLTIGFQTAIITTLVSLLFVGQDLTYSPGLRHIMFFWVCITGLASVTSFLVGIKIRRGHHEFTSY